jgi:5-methylcytosine-specific restriction endonuclease McrA
MYDASFQAQRTCGRSCGAVINRRNLAAKLRPVVPRMHRARECVICGRLSESGDNWRRYCSTQCRIDNTGYRVKDLYAAALALRLNGASWLHLLAQYIRERDGDRCAICRRKIRFDLKSGPKGHPSGLGPSIDHIVPRSVEVNDDPANLRLTHWRCNFERRAGRVGESVQLALVG